MEPQGPGAVEIGYFLNRERCHMPQEDAGQRVIKVIISNTEQDIIRLAAALNRTSMAEYAKRVVLADAERLTAGVKLPEARPKQVAGKPPAKTDKQGPRTGP